MRCESYTICLCFDGGKPRDEGVDVKYFGQMQVEVPLEPVGWSTADYSAVSLWL